MLCARRILAACLAALAIALAVGVATAGAQASPSATETIFLDYVDNRVIDGHYPPTELKAALEVAEANGAGFEEFAGAVQQTYDRDILGLSVTSDPPPDTAVDTGGGILALPEPRGPGERDEPPWPFLALTALGAALVLTGAGSSIVRRVRR
ncbi:MAG: hypothetical protein AB7V62_11605 [Thermoleophilia bacterium]